MYGGPPAGQIPEPPPSLYMPAPSVTQSAGSYVPPVTMCNMDHQVRQGSYVPPAPGIGSYVPPVELNGSYVPPVTMIAQQGSYVPPATTYSTSSYVPPAQGSYVPPQTVASYGQPVDIMASQSYVITGQGSYVPPQDSPGSHMHPVATVTQPQAPVYYGRGGGTQVPSTQSSNVANTYTSAPTNYSSAPTVAVMSYN